MDTGITSTPHETDLSGNDQLNLHCVTHLQRSQGVIDVCFYGKSQALQVENNVNKPCISVDRKDNAVFHLI